MTCTPGEEGVEAGCTVRFSNIALHTTLSVSRVDSSDSAAAASPQFTPTLTRGGGSHGGCGTREVVWAGAGGAAPTADFLIADVAEFLDIRFQDMGPFLKKFLKESRRRYAPVDGASI